MFVHSLVFKYSIPSTVVRFWNPMNHQYMLRGFTSAKLSSKTTVVIADDTSGI